MFRGRALGGKTLWAPRCWAGSRLRPQVLIPAGSFVFQPLGSERGSKMYCECRKPELEGCSTGRGSDRCPSTGI